jgi:hypothetical protein
MQKPKGLRSKVEGFTKAVQGSKIKVQDDGMLNIES